MHPSTTPDHARRAAVRGRGLLLMLWPLAAAAAYAAHPLERLPAPYFSLDRESPTVIYDFVHAADVLAFDPNQPHPVVVIPGASLGLPATDDEIDGLSASNVHADPTATFALAFSVDRATVGLAPPDPQLIALSVPYNAQEQAAKGQAAADQFVTTNTFTAAGTAARGGTPTNNNTNTRNNYDEGGTDFSCAPPTHARDSAGGAPQDNVDALAALETAADSRERVVNVYFSVRADSPSLPQLSLPFPASGAHIFFNPDPGYFGETRMYANRAALGLLPNDDIDALLVFDFNENRTYDAGDKVLFSLRPGSPSLTSLPGASPIGAAADIFVASPGTVTHAFAPAVSLGLGSPTDNVDAIMFYAATDTVEFARVHAIRLVRGDWDDDADVDVDDWSMWPICMAGPGTADPPPECDIFDFDRNGDVDLRDFAGFQIAFTGPLPP